jgi:hypothetical protein
MTKNAVLTINPGSYLDALRMLERAEDPAERYKPHPLDVEKAAALIEKVNTCAAAMLAAVQSRATARTITPADMVNALNSVEKRIDISKKALDGCRVDIDVNAQTFPRSYKYTAESTQFSAVYMHGGWRVTYIGRDKCKSPSRRYVVDLTDAAKAAIIDRCTMFE